MGPGCGGDLPLRFRFSTAISQSTAPPGGCSEEACSLVLYQVGLHLQLRGKGQILKPPSRAGQGCASSPDTD